jgi:hypothetical protein
VSVKQGVGFVILMVAACAFVVLVSQIVGHSPLVLLLLISLLIFLEFLLLARDRAVGAASIFLITTAVVPLLAMESASVAYGFIYSLIAGSALAVLLTFAAHAFFPMRVQAQPVSPLAHDERDSVALALANTGVLMSLVIYFMVTVSPVSIVIVLTVISIFLWGALPRPLLICLSRYFLPQSFFCLSSCWSGSSLATASRAGATSHRFTPLAS